MCCDIGKSMWCVFLFYLYGDHRYLNGLKHSFPTLRASDLVPGPITASSGAPIANSQALDAHVAELDARAGVVVLQADVAASGPAEVVIQPRDGGDRKSTRLNSSH